SDDRGEPDRQSRNTLEARANCERAYVGWKDVAQRRQTDPTARVWAMTVYPLRTSTPNRRAEHPTPSAQWGKPAQRAFCSRRVGPRGRPAPPKAGPPPALVLSLAPLADEHP